MKSFSYFKFLIFASIICFIGCQRENTQLYVSQYKGIFTAPPKKVPTPTTPDGPIAGNGDVGIVYAGPPDKQCFYFSKNDFWKAKPGYPEGGVCLPGGLTIAVDALKDASYHAEQTIDNGTITAIFRKGALTWKLKAWVPATDNLVVIELSAEGSPCTVNLDFWVKEGNESRVESGVKDGVYWFTRHFDTPELEWPTHLTAAMKIDGADSTTFVLKPSSGVRLIVGFCTNHDREDYFGTAVRKVQAVTGASLKQLRKEHEKWWAGFWSESKVEIGDTLIEKYYYGSQYLLASCSRNNNFPPGLWGNSLTMDATFEAWEGDYHTNYNHQAPWWGTYSSNHVALSDPYDAPILDYMENAKKHSVEFLKCRGVYYPVGLGPKGFCSSMFPLTAEKMKHYYHTDETGISGGYMFLGQKSDAVFCTANMFMRFYHTYDTAYAEKVYPFIREVANFWEDYLKFENGRYMSYDDSFWEVGPWMGKDWKKDYGDFNPTITLGMLRMFFKGILEMSIFLNTDQDRREKWQYILDHLSPVPTVEVNGNIRIKACEGGNGSGSRTLPGFGRVMMHALTFPTGVCGVKTDPAFAGILRKEIDRWGKEPMGDANWYNVGGGFETYFTSAARLGYNPDTILAKLKERILKTDLPNLWVPQAGGGIETLSAIPSSINEMLLQGYEGIIRVFPTWPANKDAKFEKLRTHGAFIVSSEKKNGNVQFIKIFSEKGRECIVENPWNNAKVKLLVNGKESSGIEGATLIIPTKVADELLLEPTQLSAQQGVSGNNNQFRISDLHRHWVIGIDPKNGITHFGLDSEDTGRAETNLLADPIKLAWDGCSEKRPFWKKVSDNKFETTIESAVGHGIVKWSVSENSADMLWQIEYSGRENIRNFRIEIPISALQTAAVLIPAKLDKNNQGLGPWLLIAPDFGHLLITSDSDIQLVGINDGVRGSGSNAVSTGVNPRLRGQKWLEATGIKDFREGKLSLKFCCTEPLSDGEKIRLRFHMSEMREPEGIDTGLWQKIRRPYLNNWQPCGTWAGPKKEMVLSNNVLSDPASISLWFYSDPMIYWHTPAEGIDMLNLLKHSLDYYLDNEVSAQGHVNAFGKMYDLYVSCGGSLIISAWDYYTISKDKTWLEKRIQALHLIADYLLRRDVDKDGLIESINSGNAGTLRDPERADIWFEMMNFGYKNTWTNLISYRAFLCLADLLDTVGQHEGAIYYRQKGALLRQAFVSRFLSPGNGWFVSWISLDGQVHDYCHTFINGMAVAYGIVPPDQGKNILEKVVAKSKTIGFKNWHLGIPANLIPCRKEDMIGPRIGIDGKPIKNDFYWPDDLTEEAAFGNRYTDGTIHPPLVWPYLLGLQVAGLHEEADRILDAMIGSAQEGLFQNGIVNVGYGGAEHFYSNGLTCGYEGYLPESFNFLMACFTRNPEMRNRLLGPLDR